MSNLRKLEREVIRHKCYKANGNTKAFKSEWDKYQAKRNEIVNADGTVTSISKKRAGKKKQRHNDNGKTFFNQLKAMKNFIANMNKAADAKAKEE